MWLNVSFTSVWKQDTRIQELEEDGSQRDGGAALQGRGCGIRGFVGQLCGERRHVRERWSASEWQGVIVRDLRDFWFKFFQKHQIWLICPLWHTVSIFAERQDERPLGGRHFEKNQDGRHFGPNMYDTSF